MIDAGLLTLVFTSAVVVELIKSVFQGWLERKRSLGEKKTRLDVALASREMWRMHANILAAQLVANKIEPLEPPDDPWVSKLL